MHAWFEGLERGRAFVSSGPLLEMEVGNAMPGDTVVLPSEGGKVSVNGRLRSLTELRELVLVCNGLQEERFPIRGDGRSLDISYELQVERSGWCHLRTEGSPEDRFPMDVNYVQAFTNPVWFQVGNQPIRNPESTNYALQWIDKLQELAEAWPGWRSEAEKNHVYSQFEEARQVYRSKLE